ncbi:MAG: hypothetical protein QG594_1455 [Bacteroidota bacterium]|nr:hypothetical protein [Bacteroidota bacterium]
MENFEVYRHSATLLHLFGVILGVGSATITDILFFKFVQNKHVNGKEAKLMDILSSIIWVALLILVVSGIMLYIPSIDRLNESGKFLTKAVALLVLIINGICLGYFIRPKLTKIDFSNNNVSRFGLSHLVNRKMRRWATICGAISISSWYFIFILGGLRGVTFPVIRGLFVYAIVLAIAIIGSFIFEGGAWQKLKRRIHEGHYK